MQRLSEGSLCFVFLLKKCVAQIASRLARFDVRICGQIYYNVRTSVRMTGKDDRSGNSSMLPGRGRLPMILLNPVFLIFFFSVCFICQNKIQFFLLLLGKQRVTEPAQSGGTARLTDPFALLPAAPVPALPIPAYTSPSLPHSHGSSRPAGASL